MDYTRLVLQAEYFDRITSTPSLRRRQVISGHVVDADKVILASKTAISTVCTI